MMTCPCGAERVLANPESPLPLAILERSCHIVQRKWPDVEMKDFRRRCGFFPGTPSLSRELLDQRPNAVSGIRLCVYPRGYRCPVIDEYLQSTGIAEHTYREFV